MVSIDREKIERIERLFAAGAELPAIAAATGCAASSVRRVLAGRHSLQLRARPDPICGVRSYRVRPTRCRGCGGLVHELPCRLCITLSWPEESPKSKVQSPKSAKLRNAAPTSEPIAPPRSKQCNC